MKAIIIARIFFLLSLLSIATHFIIPSGLYTVTVRQRFKGRPSFTNMTSYTLDTPVFLESSTVSMHTTPPIEVNLGTAKPYLESSESSEEEQWMKLVNFTDSMKSTKCEDDFGFGLIRRWSAARRTWCSPSVTCHPIMQAGHGGNGDNLCILENTIFDPASYNDVNNTRKIVLKYRDTVHQDWPYLHHNSKVLATSCSKVTSEWKDNQLPGWNLDWMVGGLSTDGQVECQSIEEKPLLIIQRHGFANFYHDSEDFFNAFLALLITGLRPDQVRVLIADLFPWGPFESFWKHLFLEVKTAWEVREEPAKCYRKIIIGIYGPASPLTSIRIKSTCFRSPLVRAYGRWAWQSFGLAPQRSDNGTRLLWMSRKPSVMWPERAYCDDRYFACADWTHLHIRQIGRVLRNDEEVVKALAGRGELRVSSSDFNTLPFQQQVAQVTATDVLAGPHGAGLTHVLFLPDWACVVELFIDGSQSNIHFTNMATWRGLRYTGAVMPNPAPAQDVVRLVMELLFRAPPPG